MNYKRIRKNLLYAVYLFLVLIISAEILLRIIDPLKASVSGDKITLQSNYTRNIRNVDVANHLDSFALFKRNSIGFRGRDLPAQPENHLTILTIGGSTTECLFIDEKKTWPAILESNLSRDFNRIWLNNAGLNGHSTFGHLLLLNEHVIKLKPKVCIFLIGINDLGRDDLNMYDLTLKTGEQPFYVRMANYSSLWNVLLNLYRNKMAKDRNLIHRKEFRLDELPPLNIGDSTINDRIQKEQTNLHSYRLRVNKLIELCKQNGIEPVLVTQPCLPGDTKDPVTGTDLGVLGFTDMNGKMYWNLLEQYNEVTKEAGKEKGLLVIDLGNQLPKSMEYFYDLHHYNNIGCVKVAAIIDSSLNPWLRKKFPKFIRHLPLIGEDSSSSKAPGKQ